MQASKKKDQVVDGTFHVYAMVANTFGVELDVWRIFLTSIRSKINVQLGGR